MANVDKEKAFEEAIIRYGAIVTKICYYFACDNEEFKDLRQETLYNIWKGFDGFKHDAKFSTWIYRVCFNTCISFRRKEKPAVKISIENVPDLADSDSTEIVEQYKTLHSLISRLKYEERAMILMWLEGISYDEISSLTGLKRNNVAIRLKRIKDKLIKMAGKE